MIPLHRVFMSSDIDKEEINKILFSGKLTSGDNVRLFEKALQDYIGNPYVMVTGSNNYASLIALALTGLGKDDEVIASPMACLASNQPALNFQAKIVWADIDPLTGSLDPVDVKKKITAKTKVILHYHWCGYLGYIDAINQIGKEYGITVIDDAIESFGSEYKDRKIGNLGTPITTFSFQTVRLPNSIDGGALAFNTEGTYLEALKMRDFGIDRTTFRNSMGEISSKSNIVGIGYNAIMNELNAYIGLQNMKAVPELLEKQRENATDWHNKFEGQKTQKPLLPQSGTIPNYWVYSLLSDEQNKAINEFKAKGLYASKVHLRNDYYSCFGGFDSDLKGVKEFEKKQYSIPSGWWVNKKEIAL